MNLKCFMGLHKWKQNRELNVVDIYPPPFMKWVRPIRECEVCGKKQYWLPGYGGSEIGCWENFRKEK